MSKHMLNEVDLFFIRLKKGWVSEKKKKLLYNLVLSLEDRTKLQKERFILTYNLKSNSIPKYNFSSLAREQKCSHSAIRYSVIIVKISLLNLKDERKNIFADIIKDDDYFSQIK